MAPQRRSAPLFRPWAVLASLAVADGTVRGKVRPSPGCWNSDSPAFAPAHSFVKRTILVHDYELVTRRFVVQMPSAAPWGKGGPAPAPLLVGIHGQTGEAESFGKDHNFTLLGHGLMAVFPQGMDDSEPGADRGTGWNVGSAGDAAGGMTCIPQGVGQSGGCYKSCRALNRCGRCNWSTCYNDVLFIKQVLNAVTSEFCIDLNRVYLMGESNGAQLVHHLVSEMPGTFAAAVPWYGLPLVGFLLGADSRLLKHRKAHESTVFMAIHGRQDVTIPVNGGVSEDGWIFNTEAQVLGVWTAFHGCDETSSPMKTPFDGGKENFQCVRWTGCKTGRDVVYCDYDGEHGDWPTANHGDAVTLSFMLQYSLAGDVDHSGKEDMSAYSDDDDETLYSTQDEEVNSMDTIV